MRTTCSLGLTHKSSFSEVQPNNGTSIYIYQKVELSPKFGKMPGIFGEVANQKRHQIRYTPEVPPFAPESQVVLEDDPAS